MKVAVFGCAHGLLNQMYIEVNKYEERTGETIDFVIVCGDCQTLRHPDDLRCICMPEKFKKVGDFPSYYNGTKKIPKLTLFVGGNHEASSYLMTLPYGGWVCENFYYLGFSNVIRYKGLRIAGISGIYNFHNSYKGRYETVPLDENSKRSIYHTRSIDVFRLELLKNNIDSDKIDLFLSHDWPAKIYEHGNKEQLLRFKPFFKEDMNSKQGLGNPLTGPLVEKLKPEHWFAAHLHCRFTAKVIHKEDRITNFLSLNKIESGKNFMEVIDIKPSRTYDSNDNDLYYDPEWLAVLKKTIDLDSKSSSKLILPTIEGYTSKSPYYPSEEEISKFSNLKIPKNFRMSEPVIYNRPNDKPASCDPYNKTFYPNPQTEEFIDLIQLFVCESKEKPQKKLAVESMIEEDGCLPFCIDKNAD